MCKISKRNREEGYLCGHCAAYPCSRDPSALYPQRPAGLCFQATRRCRQECKLYDYEEFPARGGICKVDNTSVNYEQGCHIKERRGQRLKV